MNAEVREFISVIAKKLPVFQHVGNDYTYISGAELKLTGIKEFAGKPLVDDHSYQLEVPVYKRLKHEAKIKREFLVKGFSGLYAYLAPYLSEAQMNEVMHHFMRPVSK